MNCPSRTEELPRSDGMNQSPSRYSADLTTRQDFNGLVNTTTDQDCSILPDDGKTEPQTGVGEKTSPPPGEKNASATSIVEQDGMAHSPSSPADNSSKRPWQARATLHNFQRVLIKCVKFIGPGFLISVAYIDPGNYSTDVSAGAAKQFKLLFIVLMANIFAITLQSLAVRLGTVTGMNLAEHCREHLPKWLNLILYLLGEAAIIATDIAEVIGSAIALNLLIKVPLVVACVITVLDVLIFLLFYNPKGKMKGVRAFEIFLMALVLGVTICFCIELSLLENTSAAEVFKGYLPSAAVIQGQGLYLSCGILGATVMPHSLYLGSGMVQSRLREFDIKSGHVSTEELQAAQADSTKVLYKPSVAAIRACMKYSIAEVVFCLFTCALFVNSAILIVAGGSLSSDSDAQDADLFGIHNLLSKSVAPIAGTIFALALLLSGTSAGIVCTIAGQMLSEGALRWTVAPWLRRLLTRSISIVPSIIIAGAVGRSGLSAALNATQVVLSVCLPFLSAPLIYFTCRNKYMFVGDASQMRRSSQISVASETQTERETDTETVKMRNHWLLSIFAILVWLIITIMNVALLVLVGLGKA